LPSPRKGALWLVAILVLAGAAAGLWYAWPLQDSRALSAAGMVRATEIRVAPEVSGRIVSFLARAGDHVDGGQPIASLVSPELLAAVDAARAQVEKVRSDRDRVYAGVRAEEVQGLAKEIDKAQAVYEHDVLELQRKSELVSHAFASQQDLDIARTAVARSVAGIRLAEAHYIEAQQGPTSDERALADATVAAAEAARDVIEARAAKMQLKAPAAGTVATLVAEPGEAVVPGEPVLTIIPDRQIWFGFSVREDALGKLTLGTIVPVATAAGRDVPAKVVEIRNWGEFAVWRAARATGDHDLNTFFLRLDPTAPAADLHPGQTIWLGQRMER
jgi:multidrug resistance efflux pump